MIVLTRSDTFCSRLFNKFICFFLTICSSFLLLLIIVTTPLLGVVPAWCFSSDLAERWIIIQTRFTCSWWPGASKCWAALSISFLLHSSVATLVHFFFNLFSFVHFLLSFIMNKSVIFTPTPCVISLLLVWTVSRFMTWNTQCSFCKQSSCSSFSPLFVSTQDAFSIECGPTLPKNTLCVFVCEYSASRTWAVTSETPPVWTHWKLETNSKYMLLF